MDSGVANKLHQIAYGRPQRRRQGAQEHSVATGVDAHHGNAHTESVRTITRRPDDPLAAGIPGRTPDRALRVRVLGP